MLNFSRTHRLRLMSFVIIAGASYAKAVFRCGADVGSPAAAAYPSCPEDHFGDGFGRTPVLPSRPVRVDAERVAHVGVPDPVSDDLRVNPGIKRHSGVGVPHVVQADALDPGSVDEPAFSLPLGRTGNGGRAISTRSWNDLFSGTDWPTGCKLTILKAFDASGGGPSRRRTTQLGRGLPRATQPKILAHRTRKPSNLCGVQRNFISTALCYRHTY